MDKTIPGDLPALWRQRAETLRSFGDPNSARLWDIAAVELERAQALFAAETLSLREAARESGYTPAHLGSLVKRGKIRKRWKCRGQCSRPVKRNPQSF
jgi:hypothetical protein